MDPSCAWVCLETAIRDGNSASAADIMVHVGRDTARGMVDRDILSRLCLKKMGDNEVFHAAMRVVLGLWELVSDSEGDTTSILLEACAEAVKTRIASVSTVWERAWSSGREVNQMQARAMDLVYDRLDIDTICGIISYWRYSECPDPEYYCALLRIIAKAIISSPWNDKHCYAFVLALPFSECDPRASVLRGWAGFDNEVSCLLGMIIRKSASWTCSIARRLKAVDRDITDEMVDCLLGSVTSKDVDMRTTRFVFVSLAKRNAASIARRLMSACMSSESLRGLACLLSPPTPARDQRQLPLSAEYFDTNHATNTFRVILPGGEFRGSPAWMAAHSPVLGAMERYGSKNIDGSVTVVFPDMIELPQEMQHASFLACMRVAYFGECGAAGLSTRGLWFAAACADFLMMDAVKENISRIASEAFYNCPTCDTADAVCGIIRICHDSATSMCVASGVLRLVDDSAIQYVLEEIRCADAHTRVIIEDAIARRLIDCLNY